MLKGLWGKLARCVLVLAVLAGSAPAFAQQDEGTLRQQYDALFRQTLRNPGDLDANFRFAEVASRLGDPEAAIGALERILFYNPNLPRVRLELGILYMRLGSYEMARTYLTTAISAPDVPVDVRDRVNTFLADIDQRMKPNQFSAFAQFGLRYQTNANASPQSTLVKALGFDAFLDPRYRKQPDWNSFALAGFRWSADLGTAHGDTWETTAFAYQSRQFDLGRFDLGLVEIQTGPRLAVLPQNVQGLTFRPYAILNKVMLGGNNYLGTAGAGAALNFRWGGVEIEPYIEYRRRYYTKSFEYPLATEQSGHLTILALNLGGLINADMRWQVRLSHASASAQVDYDAYEQTALDIALPWQFGVEFGSYAARWTLTPTLGVSYTAYDQPNPFVDPVHKRTDREYRIGATLDAPINNRVGLGVQVLYTRDNSSIRNYDTTNFLVSAGPTLRF